MPRGCESSRLDFSRQKYFAPFGPQCRRPSRHWLTGLAQPGRLGVESDSTFLETNKSNTFPGAAVQSSRRGVGRNRAVRRLTNFCYMVRATGHKLVVCSREHSIALLNPALVAARIHVLDYFVTRRWSPTCKRADPVLRISLVRPCYWLSFLNGRISTLSDSDTRGWAPALSSAGLNYPRTVSGPKPSFFAARLVGFPSRLRVQIFQASLRAQKNRTHISMKISKRKPSGFSQIAVCASIHEWRE